MTEYALLAPVPAEHLESAVEVSASKGKVAFGSKAGMVFAELMQIEKSRPMNALIYASGSAFGPPRVTWLAKLLGIVGARAGAHPDGMMFRPKSTERYGLDNSGHWLIFWEVTDLRKTVPGEDLKVSQLFGANRRTPFKSNFVPEGPLIIMDPF